jgi:acyl carrier protein
MTDNREIERKVGTFIRESFLTEADALSFRDDSDLLRRLDSLQILRMLMVFEAEFGIKIEDADLVPENLGTVRRVAALIARKRGSAATDGNCVPGERGASAPCSPAAGSLPTGSLPTGG